MFGVAVLALMMCVGVYAQDNNDGVQHRDANEHRGPGGPGGPGGPDGRRGPGGPGGPGGGVMDKSGDAFLQTLIAENLDKFQQLTYTDAETGQTVEYNLFVPKDYDPSQSYPLMLFVADASTVGKDVKVPLTQGYGGLIWVTDSEQAKHPCFVVVPQYKNVTVAGDGAVLTLNLVKSICEQYSIDTKRLYTTGQSMGGMMSMYINATYPKFFAAALYAGCQWDVSVLAGLANDYFIYGVGGGDERAHGGMEELYALLEGNGKHVSRAEWNAKLPLEEQEANMKALLAEGNNVNFFVFTTGSVMPEDGSGMEHMWSFDYVYRIETARDWIFEQHLD